MRHIAFLTTDLGAHFVSDDHLAVLPLRERGVETSLIRWRDGADWGAFDLVVIRSPWDYQRHADDFLDALARIDRETRLENALDIVHWNVRKTYLRDLAEAGVPIVPTVWNDALVPGGVPALLEEAGAGELVVKPVVGASGEDTFRFRAEDAGRVEADLLRVFRDRPLMAQPFIAAVLDEGETSVVWIDGQVSHALRKTPRPGEFRSQEEYGSRLQRIEPDAELAEAAARVARVVADRFPDRPLYGRVDFLPGPDGPAVGELELIEPSLYLRLDDAAPARFADAIVSRLDP